MVISGLFGVAGAIEYYRLLRADPQARSFNTLGLVICLAYWATAGWWLHLGRYGDLMWLDLAALTASVHGSLGWWVTAA